MSNFMQEQSDEEILSMMKNPDSASVGFNLLVRKYQKILYWQIRRMVYSHDDTDDILQETLIKTWKNIAGFKAESKLSTWLIRIAINESISFLRKKKKFFSDIDTVSQELFQSHINDFGFDSESVERKLYEAIAELPHKQKIVFELRYFNEMSYEEISGSLNTSVGALKASFHHAVEKIEKKLKKQILVD